MNFHRKPLQLWNIYLFKTFSFMKNLALLLSVLLPIGLIGQQFPTEHSMTGLPTTVNVTDLANYELAHPPHYVMRNFEEDEEEKEAIEHNGIISAQDIQNVKEFHFDENATRAASPAPTANFDGIIDNNTSIPPDVNAAVGPNHVMVTLNSQYRIMSKTGTVISTVSGNGFWAGTGGTNPSTFDPKILYDPYGSRWILVSCANGQASTSALLVAVSQTNDPTGTWNKYLIDADAANTSWFDYPSLGFNKDWIVVSGNMFPNTGSGYNGGKVWVIGKASVYAAGATNLTTINAGTSVFTLAPAATYDNTIGTIYMLQEYNPNSGGNAYLQMYKITGALATPALTSVSTNIGTNLPYNDAGNSGAPQSGTTNKIATNDSRIQNVVYRNGFVYATHSVYLPVTTPTRTSVQWWKINPTTNTVAEAGRIDDATGAIHYGFPSICVNANNDVLLGFSRFSSTTFGSSAYALKYATDPVNTFNTPYVYKNGLTSYYKTYGGTSNRWGDYSVVAVDPTDNSSFWTVQEYAASPANTWGTWVAKVAATVASSCASAPTGLASSAITSTGATVSWTAITGATSYNLQYKTSAATTWTTVTGITTNSKALTGLVAATTYNYQVQAVCSATSSSPYSTASSFTTAAAPCSTAPTGLASSAITSTGATVSWTAAAGATSYNLQYKTAAATTWTTVTGITTNSKALTGLVAATTYNYQVQTVCSATSSSAYSTAVNFTTLAAPCSTAPIGLASSAITSSGATVSWTAASGATSYNLQYKTAAATTWTTITGITTNSRVLTGLVAATTYNFKVQTVCSATSSSAYSTAVNFTTLAAGCVETNEPNNTLATAATITGNTDINSQISSATDLDYFSFSATGAAYVNVNLSNLPADYDLFVYSAAGVLIASSENNGTTTETINFATSGAGTYKVYILGYNGVFSTTACYKLRASVTTLATCGNNMEANETTTTAAVIPSNVNILGRINTATDLDYYKFTTTAASTISVTLTTLPADYDVVVYNSAGTQIGISQNSGTTNESVSLASQAAGTYYIKVLGYSSAFNATSCYTLKAIFSSPNVALNGVENTEEEAIAATTMEMFPNPASNRVTIQYNNDQEEAAKVEIFDMQGKEVRNYRLLLYKGSNKFDLDLTDLPSGVYNVQIIGNCKRVTKNLVISQ